MCRSTRERLWPEKLSFAKGKAAHMLTAEDRAVAEHGGLCGGDARMIVSSERRRRPRAVVSSNRQKFELRQIELSVGERWVGLALDVLGSTWRLHSGRESSIVSSIVSLAILSLTWSNGSTVELYL